MLCEFCGENSRFGLERCSRCNGLLLQSLRDVPLTTWRRVVDHAAAGIFVVLIVLVPIFVFLFPLSIIIPGWEAVIFSIKYLSIPFTIALVLGLVRQWKRRNSWRAAGDYILCYALLCLLGFSSVILLNIIGPTRGIYVIQGEVTHLVARHGRVGAVVHVRQTGSERDFPLDVPESEFEKLRLNSHFGVCFHIGWLGIPYRWRRYHDGECSFIHRPTI